VSLFPKQADRILPGDTRILCECGSDQPMSSVIELRSYALRKQPNGSHRLVQEVTGDRVCCQVCGNVFSVGPHGRFKHHRNALPIVGAPIDPPTYRTGKSQISDEDQIAPDIPLARVRPEV